MQNGRPIHRPYSQKQTDKVNTYGIKHDLQRKFPNATPTRLNAKISTDKHKQVNTYNSDTLHDELPPVTLRQ